jgi:Bacterial Ig-like domain (group 3)
MKANRRLLPDVELCRMAAAMRNMLSPRQLIPVLVLLGALPILAPSGFAQAPTPPLSFANNFFVTGDYIVAGANGMTTNFTTINGASYAVGTITVPDSNPGITGVKQVPPGAQIVAALLYWQTAEKVGVTPGGTGSGQNGYFRPLLYSRSGGPAAPGYAISGTNISGSNTVSWSSGGCNSGSTGKVLRTYRADVAGTLPVDASGNPIANTSFEVRLPSAGNATPLTLGATLVVIYRIPAGAGGPNIPLNSIVIYDGDYSQSVSQLTMTQQLQGFYDAAHNPVSRLTHIVGSGQSNKFQTVYLSSGTNAFVKLPLLYGNRLPAFPGWYGTWDNPTWTFNTASPIAEDSSYATTQVVPSSSNQGCVSWGAVILSTTVKNSDGDGILDVWKYNPHGPYPGYCDVSVNASCTKGDPAWVDLTGAAIGQKDIFLQYDYMCSNVQGPASSPNSCAVAPNGDYSFDPRLAVDPANKKTAVDKVVDAFNDHRGSPEPFFLHAVPGNSIAESQSAVTCSDSSQTVITCPFPNEPGTVGFREGLTYIKNQTINPTTGIICNSGDAGCVPVFQHGKKDSYHYALFSHGVGLPNWFLSDPTTLTSVKQSANTVTFTTPAPHGITHITGDFCTLGRVTVVFAITNPSLNGTYCVKKATPTTFQITVGGAATNFTYTSKTDPNLAVANGQVTSMSGFSDVGGQNSVISLGYGGWGPPNNPASDGNKWQVKAGTFMHEVGHSLGLTHGGTFYPKLAKNDYTPTFEVNCKPNVQTSMSYLFQVDLLEMPKQLDSLGHPLMVVDYSEEALPTLTESSPLLAGFLSNTFYDKTSWYQLSSFAGGTPVSAHCDGTPLLQSDQPMSNVSDFVSNFGWSSTTAKDINFNGGSLDVMNGHNEWDGTVLPGVAPSPGLDLQQVSAFGTVTATGVGGESGLQHPAGGGGLQHPAGGGGLQHPAGGGGIGSEITHETANSYARPPRDLTITKEEASPRYVDLSWVEPTFGAAVKYTIYRSSDGGQTFVVAGNNPGNPPVTTFKDTVPCNPTGYEYRVTAWINNDSGQSLESTPSNIVPASKEPLLTGCYTVSNFTVPSSATQGDTGLQIAWALTDDFYISPDTAWANASAGNPVTRQAASTLVAIGPLPGNCSSSGRTTLVADGVATNAGTVDNGSVDGVTSNSNNFVFTWNRTDAFCAGPYTFELDLDHVSGKPAQIQAGPNGLQFGIDINDQDTPHITTPALPGGTVGLAYNDTLTEDGGTGPFKWTVTGLPSGISQQAAYSPTITGTACLAGSYPVNPIVTDSATPQNSGTQGFTLQINKANTTTSVRSDIYPSVFQQMATFTVTVTPQYGCMPTGTVTLSDGATVLGTKALSNGTASFALSNLSVGMHSITASYSGDANFNPSNNNSAPWIQTVSKAPTQIAFNSVLPSPVFVGQPTTVSYTFSVVVSGTGSPIGPSGNITVTASDGSSCMAAAVLGAGMCTLSPAPKAAGHVTYAIAYAGDGNFVASGYNGNYDVYQLVFTTQPSNTGAGLPITPAVAVTAVDSGNNTLSTFTGGITVAIGAGTGTLSGTTTQSAVSGVATFDNLSINKIANGYTLTASPNGGVPDATSTAFNIDTYYVDANGNFGTLDLATATATEIGATPVTGSTGLDLTPALQVYAYNASSQLMQIDPSTGVASSVGSPGTVTLATTGSLTDGSYFGIHVTTGNLYSIDLKTGGTSSPIPTSTASVPAGCSFEASLSGSANVLYYTLSYSGESCTASLADTLYEINPSNGSPAAGPFTINGSTSDFVGSTFVGGTLYGFTTDGKEYSIDPTSGTATLLKTITPAGTSIVGAGSQ